MTNQNSNTTPSGRNPGLWAELLRNIQLAWRLIRDPRVSTLAKVAIPAVVGLYILSPVDLIPDVFPVLGQLDDLALIALAVRLFIQLAPSPVVAEHEADMSGVGSQPSSDPTAGNTVDASYRVVK